MKTYKKHTPAKRREYVFKSYLINTKRHRHFQ